MFVSIHVSRLLQGGGCNSQRILLKVTHWDVKKKEEYSRATYVYYSQNP
jgi:hypothetical protein